MSYVQSSAVIQVDMHVSRYRTYSEGGLVEVWGHVGDYEVCVHLTIPEAQTRGLLPRRRGTATGRKKPEPS